jgi:hypothetical protein
MAWERREWSAVAKQEAELMGADATADADTAEPPLHSLLPDVYELADGSSLASNLFVHNALTAASAGGAARSGSNSSAADRDEMSALASAFTRVLSGARCITGGRFLFLGDSQLRTLFQSIMMTLLRDPSFRAVKQKFATDAAVFTECHNVTTRLRDKPQELKLCYAPFNGHVVSHLERATAAADGSGGWDAVVFNAGHHAAADQYMPLRVYRSEIAEKIRYFDALRASKFLDARSATLWIDSAAFPHRVDEYAFEKGAHGAWGVQGDGRTNLRLTLYNLVARGVLRSAQFARREWERSGLGWLDSTLEIGRVWTDCASDNAHLDYAVWDAIAVQVWERFLVNRGQKCSE